MASVVDSVEGDLTYASLPITKFTENDDGTLNVWGPCTDDLVDHDAQIVDPEFASKGLSEWLESGANLRVMHSPNLYPAGLGTKVVREGGTHWLRSHVVEPTAITLVRNKVLRAYSVGISKATVVRDQIAKGGRITAGKVVEVSLVDRPANARCQVSIVKMAKDGSADMSDQYVLKRDFDKDTGGGVDRDEIPAEDFAGPHKSFPIVTPKDVHDAATLVGHADDPAAVKAKIKSIAARKGPKFTAQLPDSWKEVQKMDKPDDAKDCPTCKAKGKIKEGHVDCPDCGTKGWVTPDKHAELTKAAEADTAKAADDDKDEKPGEVPPIDDKVTEDIKEADAAIEQAKKDQDEDNAEHKKGEAVTSPAPYHVTRLHDILCAGFHTEDVEKAYPAILEQGFPAMVDTTYFATETAKAMEADGGTGEHALDMVAASAAYSDAVQLKQLDPDSILEARTELAKSFSDMYPDAHPMPGAVDPGKFKRPYITTGRAPHHSNGTKPRIPLQAHTLEAGSVDRGYLTAGRAAPSPASGAYHGEGSADQANKSRSFYTNAAKENAMNVMRQMHDHIAKIFPDMCPMSDQVASPNPETPGNEVENGDTRTLVSVGKVLKDDGTVDEDVLNKIIDARVDERSDKRLKKLSKKLAKATETIEKLEQQPDPAQGAWRGTRNVVPSVAKAETAVDPGKAEADAKQAEHDFKVAWLLKRAKSPNSQLSRPAMEELTDIVPSSELQDMLTK